MRDFLLVQRSGMPRVLWPQVWEPLLQDLRASPYPHLLACREEGGRLPGGSQAQSRTEAWRKEVSALQNQDPVSQLPPSPCLFRTNSVSTLEAVSSQLLQQDGPLTHSANTHSVFTLCQTLCWDHDKWGTQPLPSKGGEGGEEEGWQARREMASFLFLQIKPWETTGSERLSKWPRVTQHERS